jgi:hypothetical protein
MEAYMHYVLYTGRSSHWKAPEKFEPEFVFYPHAGKTRVLEEVFAPSDCFHSLAFWLGFPGH